MTGGSLSAGTGSATLGPLPSRTTRTSSDMAEAHASLVQLDTIEHQPLMLQPPGQHKAERRRRSAGAIDLTRCCTRGPRWRRSSGWRRKVTSRCIEWLERHRKAARQGTRVPRHNN
ncbi:hypothetical protein SORBI_3005G048250 [Sorghum bicolor]|uniref:Uncharacterized protein n=1 Tax=Sorghum bicolor TaxID=4558 RepID=A0A1Z5RGP9_SORBI|nr:hypothetical protein SORBI_3005G048250 [Sorghum bicolor]